MKFRQRYKNKSLHTIISLLFCIFLLVFGCSIAYSALSATMTITGDAIARIESDIRITNISLDSVSNNGLELYSPEYSKNTVKTGIRLDSLSSIVTYNVTIVNNSDTNMTISNIIPQVSNNSNVGFDINFNYEDKILPSSTLTLTLVFFYNDGVSTLPSNTIFESVLLFEFDEYAIPMLAENKTWYNPMKEVPLRVFSLLMNIVSQLELRY